MTEGIRTPNITPGTDLGEFIGHEIVGATRSVRRFSRASVIGNIEAIVNSFVVGGGVIFKTLTQALAALNYPANQMAWIIQDTPANNGVYQKLGSSGSGSWARVGDLPYGFYRAVNEGAGTANAIQATNGYPMANKDSLIVFNVTDDNTSSPVTLSLNGGSPMTIKTAGGNDPVVGGLKAGMMVAGYIDNNGTRFRMLSDQASAAIQSAAEAAAATAITARDIATGAMSVFLVHEFATRALAEVYAPEAAPDYIRTVGRDVIGDLGGVLYKRNGTTTGDLVITLDDTTTDVGYDPVNALRYTPAQFGWSSSDSASAQRSAIQAMIDFTPEGAIVDLSYGKYAIDGAIVCKKGQTYRGGTTTLDATGNIWGMFCAADDTIFQKMTIVGPGLTGADTTPLYQVGINSGSTTKFGRDPANRVKVRDCDISNLTVGVWLQPDGSDSVPNTWWIERCYIHDIVGLPGLSEGYSINIAYGRDVHILSNTIRSTRRHAVYGSGVDGLQVIGNLINSVDNVAIQLNGYSDQPSSYGNIIALNRIANVTQSINYGYDSSVAIGIYGKQAYTAVFNNNIQGVLQVGIDATGQSNDTVVTGTRLTISGNDVSMDSSATSGAGIRITNFPGAVANDNTVRLGSAIYGLVAQVTASVSLPIHLNDNTVTTTNSGATLLRTVVTHSSGNVQCFGTKPSGFNGANLWSDSSIAGRVRSDLNRSMGYYDTDADVTCIADGARSVDAPAIRLAGSRTAPRYVNLSLDGVRIGSRETVVNKTSGGYVSNIRSGTGTLLLALASNEAAEFVINSSGNWELAMKGAA